MKKTTNGYWKNKKRDPNTKKRLSESKFIKILQYDELGNLIKIWNSAKEVALKVFKDYVILNGGSKSKIYDVLNCKIIDNKFHHNSYWFRYSEIFNKYKKIPIYININDIRKKEKINRGLKYKNGLKKRTHIKKYTILHYDLDGKLINKYNNSKHAAYVLKTTHKVIERICNGTTKNPVFNLKYGEKTSQPIDESYPNYETIKLPKSKKKYTKTRTKYTVIQMDEFGNHTFTHNNVEQASNLFKISENLVRKLCINNDIFIFNGKKISLKYGDKKTIKF